MWVLKSLRCILSIHSAALHSPSNTWHCDAGQGCELGAGNRASPARSSRSCRAAAQGVSSMQVCAPGVMHTCTCRNACHFCVTTSESGPSSCATPPTHHHPPGLDCMLGQVCCASYIGCPKRTELDSSWQSATICRDLLHKHCIS